MIQKIARIAISGIVSRAGIILCGFSLKKSFWIPASADKEPGETPGSSLFQLRLSLVLSVIRCRTDNC